MAQKILIKFHHQSGHVRYYRSLAKRTPLASQLPFSMKCPSAMVGSRLIRSHKVLKRLTKMRGKMNLPLTFTLALRRRKPSLMLLIMLK